MGRTTGNFGDLLLGFALAAVIGVLAALLLIILGGYNWSAAVFLGLIIAVVLAALLGYLIGTPLPSLAEIRAKAAATAKPAPVMAATTPMATAPANAAEASVAAPIAKPAPVLAAVIDDATIAAAGAGTKPAGLSAPRGGKSDDLKNIEGVGPVLERLCHDMGIYHFDQIAGWGAGEVAWMNANLKGFKGRVGRDKWVAQARLIGSVGLEEFKRRAETNDY